MRNRSKLKYFIAVLILVCIFYAGKVFLDRIYVPVIIMYHSVGDQGTALDGYGDKLNVSTESFDKHMTFIKIFNYKVIPLREFIERIKNGEKIPQGTIAITFDDGVKNNFEEAYPILKKYGFTATIFVPTDFIGKEKFLNWNEIKIMQRDNISIGSHTESHTWLPSMTYKEIQKELRNSKEILEKNTGVKIDLFSYPLGGFDERVKRIAKEEGYVGAVSTNPGEKSLPNDIYALKRVRISETANNPITFLVETSGYYTFIKEKRDDQ